MRRMLIAAALGALTALPATAHADTDQMSGHYIDTETARGNGASVTNHWYATPCGESCASIQNCDNDRHEGCQSGQARLSGGEWSMDIRNVSVECPDGSVIPNAFDTHYTWDAQTLAGVAVGNRHGAACPGLTSAPSTTTDFQLRPAS